MSALALAQNGARVQVLGFLPMQDGVGFRSAGGLFEPVATRDERAPRWTAESLEFLSWSESDPSWASVSRKVLFLSDNYEATAQDWMKAMGRREASHDELQGRREYGAWFDTYVMQPDLASTAFHRESRNLDILGLTNNGLVGATKLESVESAAERALLHKSDAFILAAGLGLASLTDIEDLTGMGPAAGMSAGMGLTIRIPAESFSPRLDHVVMDDDELGYLIPQQTHVIAGGTNDIAEHDDPVVSVGVHPALLAEWEGLVRNKIDHLLPGSGDLRGEIRVGARPMRARVLTHWTEEFNVPGILLGGAGGSGWTFSVGIAHDVCRVLAQRLGCDRLPLALGSNQELSLFPEGFEEAA